MNDEARDDAGGAPVERERSSRFASDLEDDVAFVRTPAHQVDELLVMLGLAGDQRG